jgi:hypothetical protein
MVPVRGSVAAACVATLISLVASNTSEASTSSDRRIFASACDSRMSDSSCRGVAVMVFMLRLPRGDDGDSDDDDSDVDDGDANFDDGHDDTMMNDNYDENS